MTIDKLPQWALGLIAVFMLLRGALHLVYHAGHLDGLDGADKVVLIGSLVSIPVLAAVVLWAHITTEPKRAP